ncbi:neuropeptide Y-like [Anoplolepis gracilipes]|uniref:neuropeptide Y-like n=1 Tax=Anoplolepis gracilipes TaxID=354296 RepID=UPI003BA31D47
MGTWMMSLAHFSCCLLLVAVVGTLIVHADPEPMARPTRPKVIGSPEELKRYADLVRDYYFLIGKARYGKRSDIVPMSELNSAWEILRMIQDARRQNEQRRQEKLRQNKEQVLFRDFQNSDVDKHTSHAPVRPGFLSDIIGNYDDVQ